MSRTTWSIAPYKRGNDWLLQDGTVLPSPQVEATPSQRRWRIAGTSMSVDRYELPQKIHDYMLTEARRLGTDVWMQFSDNDDHSGFGVQTKKTPDVSFDAHTSMPIRFDFKHPQYPLMVVLWIQMSIASHGTVTVSSFVSYRPGDPLTPQDFSLRRFTKTDPWHTVNGTSAYVPPPEIDFPLDSTNFGSNMRKAASHFLELLHKAQDVDTLSVPDGRNPMAWLTYDFAATNYTQDFYRAVLDVVQGGPAMERLAQHLDGVKRELRNLGLVVSNAEGFDLKALLNGKLDEMKVQITPQEEDAAGSNDRQRGNDQFHKVVLDLTHGAFIVNCTRTHLEEAAEQWNIAKFKAEISGETDVLAAFVDMQADARVQKRLRKILSERRIDTPDT